MKERKRQYVGILPNWKRERFSSAIPPTHESHGKLYAAVIGPFRTIAGAEFMKEYGHNNPHLQCVADAERLAKRK